MDIRILLVSWLTSAVIGLLTYLYIRRSTAKAHAEILERVRLAPREAESKWLRETKRLWREPREEQKALEAEHEVEIENQRWAFIRFHCPELQKDMSNPTFSELRGVIALPQHHQVRERLLGWERDEFLTDEFGRFELELELMRMLEKDGVHFNCVLRDSLPDPFDKDSYGKEHMQEAQRAWLKELVDPQIPLELSEVETASNKEEK